MNEPRAQRPGGCLRSLVRMMLLGVMVMIGLGVGCQSKLIYFPRPYAAGVTQQWARETGGRSVEFQTSQGRQRAFLQGNLESPRNLWIVCGGNATLALDWSGWLAGHAPREDAWLMVDFPGYGDCQGSPNPQRIRETFRAGLPAAFQQLGWPREPDPARLRFFGHSLGGAACLIAATDYHIQRGVLVAPFTSTMDMARVLTGLPVGFLVRHRFDNKARLADLAARGPGKVVILHGSHDEIIPIAMSRELARKYSGLVALTEIPGGDHNGIASQNPTLLAHALRIAGEPVSR